jgi:2,4'-dihydroxyacetophenone dioxygenase
MITIPTPGPVTTSTGAPLPFVGLPYGKLLTVNANDIPLLRDVLGEGVSAKVLRLDLENGEWVVLATFAPGARLPLHYHTGSVSAWTISGRWNYVEHADQPQTAGSYLFEPGASVHTLSVPESNTEDTVVLYHVRGSNVNFTDDGQFHSILDAALISHLASTVAAERNLDPVNYISGGAATPTNGSV